MLLPIGTDNFRKIIENKSIDFIDKSLFIKEVFDDSATEVTVITRPRRFGKTLALSMLHHFLASEINGLSTRGLFDNLKITQMGDEYMAHQGKYPVIFVTFKGVKNRNLDEALESLTKLMSRLYSQHKYLLQSPHLDEYQKKVFQSILSEQPTRASLKSSLFDLTSYLYQHHGIKPWLLIDEYDTPLQAAYVNNLDPTQTEGLRKEDEKRINYYPNMTHLMRTLLGDALKTNPYLHRAVITGILRIAKESLFSDLNNVEVYSLLENEYSQHFGFTEEEIENILQQANLTNKADEIKHWYNGYLIGDTIVYNPWSIASCIKKRGELRPYWVNTGENQLIKDLLKNSTINFKEQFEQLMRGKSVTCLIDENMVFQYLNANPTAIWSLFLMSGYLKPLASKITRQGRQCELAVPNREVGDLYAQIIEQWLSNGLGIEWFNAFIQALLTGNIEKFKKGLDNIILQITSYHDFTKEPEAFFHGLMLGFIARLHNNGYEVQSNKESGQGRFDIMLIPDDKKKLGIIIELKNCKSDLENNNKNQNLIKLAQEALKQIDERKYPEMLKQHGIANILKIGIAFCVKEFELVSSTQQP